MRQRCFKAVFPIAFVFLAAWAAPSGAQSDLRPGSIPFGAGIEETLKKYEGADVAVQATPYIESIGNYAVERYFKGGLQKDDSGVCFLPTIVKKYVVRDKSRKDFDSLTLYFGGFEKDAEDYRLFMIKKTGPKPPADEDFKEIFKKMAGNLDREMGTTHSLDQGRIQSFDQQAHAFYLPALVGTWESGETLAFLMVANSLEGPLSPEKIFVSRPALKRYLEVCKTY